MRAIWPLAFLLLAAPLAAAHAAPAPASYETRLLHDHNDDSAFLVGRHGFDTIALDARAAFDADFNDTMLVLKLVLNGGCSETGQTACETLSEVVNFQGAGQAHRLAFVTADEGATWTGDFDRFEGPFDLNDGTRFAVEGWIRFSSLGITSGDALTDWFVEGYGDDEAADNMPAGVDNTKSTNDATGPLGTAFDIGSFDAPDTDGYATMTFDDEAPATIRLAPGQSIAFNLTVQNDLDVPQTLTLTSTEVAGLPAFVSFGDAVQGAAASVDLDADGEITAIWELINDSQESINATLDLRLTSSLGGFQSFTVPVEIIAPAPPEPEPTGNETEVPDADEESPALPFAALVVGLVIVALRRRS